MSINPKYMGLAMQPPVQGMTFGVVQRRSAKASRCRTDRESPRRVSAGDTSLTVKKKEEGCERDGNPAFASVFASRRRQSSRSSRVRPTRPFPRTPRRRDRWRARIAHRARLEPATSPPRESTRRRDAPFYPSSVSHVSRARRRSRDSASANARPRRRSHEDRAGARLGLPRRVGARGLVPGRVASRRTNFPSSPSRPLRTRVASRARRRVGATATRPVSLTVSSRLVSSRLVSSRE